MDTTVVAAELAIRKEYNAFLQEIRQHDPSMPLYGFPQTGILEDLLLLMSVCRFGLSPRFSYDEDVGGIRHIKVEMIQSDGDLFCVVHFDYFSRLGRSWYWYRPDSRPPCLGPVIHTRQSMNDVEFQIRIALTNRGLERAIDRSVIPEETKPKPSIEARFLNIRKALIDEYPVMTEKERRNTVDLRYPYIIPGPEFPRDKSGYSLKVYFKTGKVSLSVSYEGSPYLTVGDDGEDELCLCVAIRTYQPSVTKEGYWYNTEADESMEDRILRFFLFAKRRLLEMDEEPLRKNHELANMMVDLLLQLEDPREAEEEEEEEDADIEDEYEEEEEDDEDSDHEEDDEDSDE